MVAKPLTYMNLSGDAVRLLVNGYLESPAEMIVVYDDIDLPLGKLRIRPNGSSGTHNGMRSIVAELATENFPRLRVGIGALAADDLQGRLRDYVLDEFSPEEEPIVARAEERAVDALFLFVRGDLKRAMNLFNRDDEPAPPAPPVGSTQ
jgi:PTH1 family peptidyl-tRNA hydrolase